MVECDTSDPRMKNGHNTVALNMLLQQNSISDKLRKMVQEIQENSVNQEASFDCIPENVDYVQHSTGFMKDKR